MVERVTSLSQVVNTLPEYSAPMAAVPTESFDDSIMADLPIRGDFDPSSYELESSLDEARMYEPILGISGYNPRIRKAYDKYTDEAARKFENYGQTQDDIENLAPLAKELNKYRIPLIEYRYMDKEKVSKRLDDAKNNDYGVPLYLAACAEDGLKDPNQGITFENLKNPLKLVNTLKSTGFTAQQANENIDKLTEIAIKEKSPELAACLLKGTSRGISHFGVDEKTAKKLLVDSKEIIKKNGGTEEDYNQFISNIGTAYKDLFKGESLDDYINGQFKPAWQKAAPFVLAGVGLLLAPLTGGTSLALGLSGITLAGAGAVAGGTLGTALYSSHSFGHNEEGEKLQETVNKARSRTHNFNPQRLNGGISGEVAFGGLTSPELQLPALQY